MLADGSVVWRPPETTTVGSQRSSTLGGDNASTTLAAPVVVSIEEQNNDILEEEDDSPEEGDHPEDARSRRPGGQMGRQRRRGIKRIALTVSQQLQMIEFFESQASRISYSALGAWAKEEFCLRQAPSKGFISKVMKNKKEILEKTAEALSLDRKRRKPVNSANLSVLERLLLEWIQHHDATHGGRIPLSDAMIIEQVQSHLFAFIKL